MVKLGFPRSYMYPNTGIVFENGGGRVIVKGRLDIGNGSVISVGKSGILDFADNVHATASFKLACYHRITIKENALFGWDCLVMDTDLHSVTYTDNNKNPIGKSKGYAPIIIGADTWIGNGCLLLKGVTISDNSVISARTFLRKGDVFPPFHL